MHIVNLKVFNIHEEPMLMIWVCGSLIQVLNDGKRIQSVVCSKTEYF